MHIEEIIQKIVPADRGCMKLAQTRFDNLIKPVGSLAKLEEMTSRYCGIKGIYEKEDLDYPKRDLLVWCGIEEAAQAGILGGFPVLGVHANVYDGSYHEVDSSEMAFHIAGSMAFKDAMRKADPIITEPIMKVAVIVPDEYLGDVIGDLNARRGQIQGMEAMAGTQRVNAFVPLAQMFGYATDLRSKTQGRGQYVMEPSHYEPVPKNIADQIIAGRTKG